MRRSTRRQTRELTLVVVIELISRYLRQLQWFNDEVTLMKDLQPFAR